MQKPLKLRYIKNTSASLSSFSNNCDQAVKSQQDQPLTLLREALIFFRHRARSSLDSKAQWIQVPGGWRYLGYREHHFTAA